MENPGNANSVPTPTPYNTKRLTSLPPNQGILAEGWRQPPINTTQTWTTSAESTRQGYSRTIVALYAFRGFPSRPRIA